MRCNSLLLLTAVFAGAVLVAGDVWAQGAGSTSGSVPSLFGTRTMGSATGATGSTLGGGGIAGGGLTGALGGNQGMADLLQGNLATGNERFVRGNQGGFVGADSAEVSAIGTSMTGAAGGRNTQGQNIGRGGNTAGRNNQGRNQTGRQNTGRGGQNQRRLQAKLAVAFRYPQPIPAAVSANLTARVQQSLSSRLENVAGVEVEGRLVTLRGSVASRYDRMLAEKLVMLEPGVSRVDNRLLVVPPQPAAEQPAEPR